MPNAFQSGLFNPYAAGYVPPAYSYSGYGAGAPYSAAGYGGYSSAAPYAGGGYGSSYGASNAYMNPYAQGYASAQPNSGIPAYSPSASQSKQQSVLGALGIPNEDGAVQWPLAFRLMSPDKKRELLDPLESQLKVAATQAASDKANPAVLKQAKQNVEDLHKWLLPRRLDLAEGTYRDAVRFLAKLDNALATIRSGS